MGFEQQYDSVEEKWFSFYIQELLNSGWLDKATYHPEAIVMAEDYYVDVFEKRRAHNEPKKVKLARSLSYSADWELVWNPKAEGIFYWKEGGIYVRNFYPYSKARANNFIPFFARMGVSLIDVKGGFVGRSNTSAVSFPVKQKLLLKEGTFVQKVVVDLKEKGIFNKTFFPRSVVSQEVYRKDYVRNGKTLAKQGDSKIKVDIKLIETFVRNKINK
ncbi:hypothetical protein [uncultured Mediterranean phage]|nr:hypothetical protein [uncultured Mediterranean phage]